MKTRDLVEAIILQWRPGLLPRLTAVTGSITTTPYLPAMEAGTIAPADVNMEVHMNLTHDLQWRPGLLPRLTLTLVQGVAGAGPAMEAGTIAPADGLF